MPEHTHIYDDHFGSDGGNQNIAKDHATAIQQNYIIQGEGDSLAPGVAPPLPHLFIGRNKDMAALRQRLCGEAATTLITAVRGWPGIGKTTLAAALAHDCEFTTGIS